MLQPGAMPVYVGSCDPMMLATFDPWPLVSDAFESLALVGKHDPVVDAVAVCIGSEKGMVQIDAGIDDDNRLVASINPGETGICPKLIQVDQRCVCLRHPSFWLMVGLDPRGLGAHCISRMVHSMH
jgi:hypothetical protein